MSLRIVYFPSLHGCEVIQAGTNETIWWNAAGTGFQPGDRVQLMKS